MRKIKSEYMTFLKKHFPYSSVIDDDNVIKIYSRICENNIITDGFFNSSRKHDTKSDIFINRYNIFLNRILLIIPTNDKDAINYYIRCIIENLLKYVLAINSNKEFEDINRLSYRNIKDNLKDSLGEDCTYYGDINKLISIYAEYSNLIHKKDFIQMQEIELLESILIESCIDLKELDHKILDIINIYERIISNHYKLGIRDLSSKICISLKKNLSKGRHKKVMENLYKPI